MTDSGEQAFIENLLVREGDKNVYWLGGYCRADRRFQWLTGEPFLYTNWAPHQPDNARGQDRLMIVYVISGYRQGHWDDGQNNLQNLGYRDWSNLGFIIEWN
ncbi:MAG: hypothetical protein LBT14_07565 [Treponema sp.]|nr:hypothetical protein [Treponema sp.]